MKNARNIAKSLILGNPLLRAAFSPLRAAQIARDYRIRREHYAAIARERGLRYSEDATTAAARARIKARGWTTTPRKVREIHTFTFVPRIEWHASLFPDLRELGPVTEFDYAALGYKWAEFRAADRRGIARRKEMNALVLPALRRAHAERPVDWFFAYASGLELSADTLRRITDELGIPTVGMCLDDMHGWTGPWMGDHHAGQKDIAAQFDLSWTSSSVACEWYLAESARPIHLPEGFDASLYRPLEVARDIPVSFVGAAYGFRPSVIKHLTRHGVPIQTFGAGWPNGYLANAQKVVETFNRSRINLGMGGVMHCETLTHLKGRDFDIPGTGGGAYLTSYNADLARYFKIGKEILCYATRDELVEQLRHYLDRPDETQMIARNARERCLAEHRWLHRYLNICKVLGIIQ